MERALVAACALGRFPDGVREENQPLYIGLYRNLDNLTARQRNSFLAHAAEARAACNRRPDGAATKQLRATPWGEGVNANTSHVGAAQSPRRPTPWDPRSAIGLSGNESAVSPLTGLVRGLAMSSQGVALGYSV